MRGVRYDATRGLIEAQGPLLGLIAVIFGIFLFQGWQGRDWYLPYMCVPLQVTEAWQALGEGNFGREDARAFGTLITCAFLHGGADHVIYNMLFLWVFAALVAELIGHRWMFGIFFFTALTASIFQVALNPQDPTPGLGASGALMGFEGAYLGMAIRWHLPDPHVWPMARPISPGRLAAVGVVGVYFDLSSIMDQVESNIAYGAHIGGFVGGILLAALAPLRPRGASLRR
jgi:membrane associated rhomboid family serine protease